MTITTTSIQLIAVDKKWRVTWGHKCVWVTLAHNREQSMITLGRLADYHLSDWHLADWHLADWHLADWHLADWHLAYWHLSYWHLADYHLADRKFADLQLADYRLAGCHLLYCCSTPNSYEARTVFNFHQNLWSCWRPPLSVVRQTYSNPIISSLKNTVDWKKEKGSVRLWDPSCWAKVL